MKYETSYYWNAGTGGRKNEDSLSLQSAQFQGKEVFFLLVCDGIGGLPRGEWASGFVAEQLTQWFWERAIRSLSRRSWGSWGRFAFWRHSAMERVMRRSILRCLYRIQKDMEHLGTEWEMNCGTTYTGAIVWGKRYLLFHCGDSRAYLLGKKEKQLTRDHQKDGKLERCMGTFGYQKPDLYSGRLRRGEVLLLCTDGYCGDAPARFFAENFRKEQRLEEGLNRIGRFLLAHQIQDNLSAVALRIS